MVGHCLAGAGAIESVASVLQIKEQFIFPNINCEDIHSEISELIDAQKIPMKMIEKDIHIVAKASFGFGDVNACVILKNIFRKNDKGRINYKIKSDCKTLYSR